MSFWCQALKVPWHWQFRAYPGVWLMVGLLAFSYFKAVYRRHRRTGAPVDRRRLLLFCFASLAL